MRACLSSTNYEVMVNGSASKEILFSHFLFTIAVDVLSRMMLIVGARGLLEGFLIRSKAKLSHLQFANDIIFFLRVNMEELQNFRLILIVFRRISRLKINVNKSTLSIINMS